MNKNSLGESQWAYDLANWALKDELPPKQLTKPNPRKVTLPRFSVSPNGLAIRMLYLSEKALTAREITRELGHYDCFVIHPRTEDMLDKLISHGMVMQETPGFYVLSSDMREFIIKLRNRTKESPK